MEIDRAHRAFGPWKCNGQPHNIVKLPYFRTQELLLHAARESLSFQDLPYSLYADLAYSTIQKRQALIILQNAKLLYYWGLGEPQALLFSWKHPISNSHFRRGLLLLSATKFTTSYDV